MRKNTAAETVRKKHKGLKIFLLILVCLLIAALAGTVFMVRDELAIIRTIRKLEGDYLLYQMDYPEGYHLDEVLKQGVSSDQELEKILTAYISHGFYSPPTQQETHIGCSNLTCRNEAGHTLWGRNFDWDDSVPIIVRATPKDGYASISTCEFSNITGSFETRPEGLANSFLAVAAYYVPVDGVNEKGLCVADLEINEGGQLVIDTDKPDITMTVAIRMLLDRAATADEAITLLDQYDVFPSGGISAHLAISDRSGRAVVVEFMEGGMTVTDTSVVTNFNIRNGNPAAGGESARQRFERLSEICDAADGILSVAELTKAMKSVSQKDGAWKTRWTVIYEDPGEDVGKIDLTYYREGDFQNAYLISLKP